jgi:hypothetical protein
MAPKVHTEKILQKSLTKEHRNHLQKSIRVSSTLTQKITQNYEKKDIGYPIIE